MKCNKCGNEFENEKFCPVCGYPASTDGQKEKYSSQFGDNFDMNTDEETGRIIDRATQAQMYNSQFNPSSYSSYEDISSNSTPDDNDRTTEYPEEISSNSNENLATYGDEYGEDKEDDNEEIHSKSKKPLVITLVIILILIIGAIAWFITAAYGANPFMKTNATEPATQATDAMAVNATDSTAQAPSSTQPQTETYRGSNRSTYRSSYRSSNRGTYRGTYRRKHRCSNSRRWLGQYRFC